MKLIDSVLALDRIAAALEEISHTLKCLVPPLPESMGGGVDASGVSPIVTNTESYWNEMETLAETLQLIAPSQGEEKKWTQNE